MRKIASGAIGIVRSGLAPPKGLEEADAALARDQRHGARHTSVGHFALQHMAETVERLPRQADLARFGDVQVWPFDTPLQGRHTSASAKSGSTFLPRRTGYMNDMPDRRVQVRIRMARASSARRNAGASALARGRRPVRGGALRLMSCWVSRLPLVACLGADRGLGLTQPRRCGSPSRARTACPTGRRRLCWPSTSSSSTVLLFLTGGIENPFVILTLAPVMISAVSLPRNLTVMLLALMIAAGAADRTRCTCPCHGRARPFSLPLLYRIGMWASLSLGGAFVCMYASLRLGGGAPPERCAGGDGIRRRARAASDADRWTRGGGGARTRHAARHDHARREGIAAPPGTRRIPRGHRDAGAADRAVPRDPRHADVARQRQRRRVRHDDARRPDRGGRGAASQFRRRPSLSICEGAIAPQPLCRRSPAMLYGLGNLIENAVDFAEIRRVRSVPSWTAGPSRS